MLLVGGAGVLLIASALARAAAAARTTDSTANDKWTPPESYHYDDAASFRGLTPDGKVEHYDVAGHACVHKLALLHAPCALTSECRQDGAAGCSRLYSPRAGERPPPPLSVGATTKFT